MKKIYEIIDSFLVEAKDQDGNERSLERLNQDRHLAVKEIEAILEQSLSQQREAIVGWCNKGENEGSEMISKNELIQYLNQQ